MFSAYFENEHPQCNFPDMIQLAEESQIQIGLTYLTWGFLTTAWIDAMEAYDCQHPSRILAALMPFIWTDITDALWRAWNELVHHPRNLTDLATDDELADQLLWYSTHHQDVLAPSDYLLARTNSMMCSSMSWSKTLCFWNLVRHEVLS